MLIKKKHKPHLKNIPIKALSVFSGGLDSMLASELIRRQGIEVTALFFETPFFDSQCAEKSAALINLPLKVVDISERHLEIVKNPKHGYGGNMNPCIDCHALMFRIAGEMLHEENACFIISGEVLGQRPMSQKGRALALVADESGMEGLLLRPLSAKLLPLTTPEKEGWVDRQALKDISGRSRKPQMNLARSYGFNDYPSPAGGCLLTDIVFSRRLKDLFKAVPNPSQNQIELLKTGRHFRLDEETKVVVGRNQSENEIIRSLYEKGDLMFDTLSIPGPTVLLTGNHAEEIERMAAAITASYSDAGVDEETEIVIRNGLREKIMKVRGRDKRELKNFMI